MTHHYTSRTGDIGGDDQIGTRICRLLADITCLHRDCIDVGSTYYVVPSLERSGTTAWPVWPSRASYEEHWYYCTRDAGGDSRRVRRPGGTPAWEFWRSPCCVPRGRTVYCT